MACANKYQKSSLRAYNTNEQTLTSGNPIQFTTVGEKSGVSISFSPTDSNIYLKSPGLYLITLDATITSETAATDLTVQLYKNNIAITGAKSLVTIITAGNYSSTTISAIVGVPSTCPCIQSEGTIISATVTGTTPVVDNANINIVKLA